MKTVHLVREAQLVKPEQEPPPYTCVPCGKAFEAGHCEFCEPMKLNVKGSGMEHVNCHAVDV